MTQAEDLAHELATEQAHVDAVYARLNQATDTARSAARSGANMYRSERDSWLREEAGTALFERDAFSFQAARRLAELDAEHEGLVFGRLDLDDPTEREVRYIGRIGVRDDDYEPLVIDWRARAAEAFYRLVDATYERRSLAVTSNIHPSGYDTIMPKTLATAAVDRLLHHAHVIITEGTSLRLAEATTGRGVIPLT